LVAERVDVHIGTFINRNGIADYWFEQMRVYEGIGHENGAEFLRKRCLELTVDQLPNRPGDCKPARLITATSTRTET
jgi:hypothetical protein